MSFFADLAGPGGPLPVRAEFPAERQLGWEEFAGVVQSMSCAPLAGDGRYAGMQAALAAFFARWREGGLLRMEEVCYVSAGRVLS